ncbi:hypothetical protein KI387_006974, partial [Taxus chinensis]
EEGCLAKTDDDLDKTDFEGRGAPKIDLIGGTKGALVFGDEDDGSDKRDVSLICKEALMVEEVDNEETVPYEEGTLDAVIVGVITVGKETGRVKIEDASEGIEVGITMGTLTKGMVTVKMGVTEVEVSVVRI